jgi:TolA-binding protein
MTDIHPDDLLDRKREGTLDEASRARLEAHLASCSACAIEARFADDFARQPTVADDAAIERALQGAMRALPPSRSRWRLRVAVGLAAMLVVAIAWAASSRPWSRPTTPSIATDAAIASVAPAVSTAPSASVSTLPSSTVEPSTPAKPVSTTAPSAPPVLSAAELFARANDARRSGDPNDAVRLYRELQKLHPKSAEATTSRVTLGRLLLDRLGDAAGAKKEFLAYLAAAPMGTLDEEARVGLALAAAKLGDAPGERAAWQDLLAKHPDSVQADRAKKRLDELGP